jgi:iron complex outermembrane receptor protein
MVDKVNRSAKHWHRMKIRTWLIAGLAGLCAERAPGQSASQPASPPPVAIAGAALAAIPQSDSSAATVVSGQEVQFGGLTSIRDLSAQTPDLTVFDSDNQRMPKFSIRGYRENNFGAGQPVAGLYVDDVPYFDMDSRGLELFDVREIQFVRGDQGTLCGASGVGGVINVLTPQPGNVTHGYAQAGYGSYNGQDYRLGLGGPIVTNQLFLSLDGLDSLRDGFVNNNTLGGRPDARDSLAARGSLRWIPSAPWNITLSADAARYRDGFVPTFLPGSDANPFSVSRNLDGHVDTDNVDEALKIAYDAGSARITSVTTHRDWRQNLLQDFDFSALNLADGFSDPAVEQWSEELRAQSPQGADRLQWLAGAFYFYSDQQTDSGYTQLVPGQVLPPPAPLDMPPITALTLARSLNKTYAAFGQATLNVGDHLDLTAGVRLTYDTRSMSRVATVTAAGVPPTTTGAYNLSRDFTAAQPKFAAAWHITPKDEVYASATQAYRSGGFNPSVDAAALSAYGAERSWQFEMGAKTSWLGGRLAVNAALFYTEADDYQTFRLNPQSLEQAYMLNARRAEMEGAELELTARPSRSLDLYAGMGYTHAIYQRFTEPAAAGGLTLDGKPISFVPEFTLNLSARYRLPWWHLFVSAQLIGIGRYELDDADNVSSGPTVQSFYTLVNAQAGYQGRVFSLYLFANNIFDRRYFNNAMNLGYSSLVLEPGDPATLGVAAAARF